ncbi:hypothetical protein [Bradyrhizobium sp. ARR65]|uniref:hypothetical protein n=1 Tax=Bradyrhizobium sp. ARR65 TaxID=1040989 RepID=UPI0018DCA203|nr:hypothetical protein [Bradyrhizobium sp. ARR65]
MRCVDKSIVSVTFWIIGVDINLLHFSRAQRAAKLMQRAARTCHRAIVQSMKKLRRQAAVSIADATVIQNKTFTKLSPTFDLVRPR